MKIFKTGHSVNVVDKNNVFVGVTTHQRCCEEFNAYLKKGEEVFELVEGEDYSKQANFEGYVFDTTYFREESTENKEMNIAECNIAEFKLTKEGCEDVFLVLSNSHNGYYYHGFTMRTGYDTKRQDSIIDGGV